MLESWWTHSWGGGPLTHDGGSLIPGGGMPSGASGTGETQLVVPRIVSYQVEEP